MSEEQIAEALGAQENLDQVVEETVEDQVELDLSPAEQRAYNDGWRPEDQFEGNPDNWKTAEAYNLYGEMQGEVRAAKAETRRLKEDTEARIANLNKYHEAQQTAAINDLKAKQRQAVSEADTEEFDRLETQIKQHETVDPAPVTQQAKDPVIAAWEEKNPWIGEPGNEKAEQAQAFWAVAAAKPGATAQSALDYVDQQIAKLHPDQIPTNPRRNMPTQTEQSSPRSRQRGNKDLTMNDLTSDERSQWTQFGSMMFKDEKEFLKAVADGRKS